MPGGGLLIGVCDLQGARLLEWLADELKSDGEFVSLLIRLVDKFGAGMVERAAPSRVSWCAPLKKRARSDTLHLFAAPLTLFCQQTG